MCGTPKTPDPVVAEKPVYKKDQKAKFKLGGSSASASTANSETGTSSTTGSKVVSSTTGSIKDTELYKL